MEGKNSNLKEDIVTLKEALNKAVLEKDVLEQEKAEISKLYSDINVPLKISEFMHYLLQLYNYHWMSVGEGMHTNFSFFTWGQD